jgi:Peptidase_C39 like family
MTTAVRTATVVAFVSIAGVPGCHSATPSATSRTSSSTTSPSSNPPSTPAAASPTIGPGVYGDPGAVAKYWHQQSREDNCGLISVSDVVGEITGNQPSEEQMITLAQNTPSGTNPGPMYAASNDPSHAGSDGGVEMADLVLLLGHFGIKSQMMWAVHPEQTGMPAVQQYLGDGRKVIAWVNNNVIWNTGDERAKANHYVVVTAIDTNKQIVHLNDPGADQADEQVPVGTFTNAWHTGEESIIVTAPPG